MRLLRAYLDLVSRWQWSLLLVLLLATLLFEAATGNGPVSTPAVMVLHLLIFIGAVWTCTIPRRLARVGLVFIALWGLLRLAHHLTGETALLGPLFLLSITLLIGTLGVTLVQLLTRSESLDALFGAVFCYFLMGLTWALFFQRVELWAPGSFAIGDTEPTLAEFTYFSLVTLTTLGYGDIAPLSPVARVAAGLEAAFGTLYVAIFIGRVVGRFSGRGGKRRDPAA
ncbi:hypothetical protein LNKW23_29080 [Paralimibaculum aggregatum]|uniref:Potassium channel domain-containing protein n=1 Tax=Paralimibaculum aggregatum TaxID=3036245 RepID=A0ABQ6LRG4_9RHOB|nr:potassium channel family protein [Limibaculum sp. NKW23]GMG83695.1 hypothetical protein LNKW23_29080 [Limibaculum sp. NKW23]